MFGAAECWSEGKFGWEYLETEIKETPLPTRALTLLTAVMLRFVSD